MALQAIRSDHSIQAIYGFSGGGYNARHVLDLLTDDEKERIRLVVVLGAPGNAPGVYHGPWELVYRLDPGHMDGPARSSVIWWQAKRRSCHEKKPVAWKSG